MNIYEYAHGGVSRWRERSENCSRARLLVDADGLTRRLYIYIIPLSPPWFGILPRLTPSLPHRGQCSSTVILCQG